VSSALLSKGASMENPGRGAEVFECGPICLNKDRV
jgi:hypothetical protein